jgi:hypothetical protein
LRIVETAKILPQQRIAVPNLLQHIAFGHHLRDSGNAHLVVAIVEVAQLDLRIGCDLDRLVVTAKVGDVDGEAIGADRRDGRRRAWSPSIVARCGNGRPAPRASQLG